jgi:predicted ATPase
MVGAKGVPASLMSEGTMLALGLLTILLSSSHPQLILMDDIDRALHPKAQKDLISIIRAVLEENPDIQMIATSHSPYLLDCLDYDQVRIMHRDAQGHVKIGRPADHPDFDKWKEEMAPGEFWSLFGEKWLAG